MSIATKLDQLHDRVKTNRWFRYFANFNRVVLAAGFLPSGFVKVAGERFTDLANEHPMGSYLEAFYHTGYYYPFVGVMQMTAAILLLIPRTATLGAMIYFPIILNICILSFSVRFDGSLFTSPLMVLANLYLLAWDYDKLKFILPLNHQPQQMPPPRPQSLSNRFPILFFAGVAVVFFAIVLIPNQAYRVMPRNSISECKRQCPDNVKPEDCLEFCACIHQGERPWDQCLEAYQQAPSER